MKGVEPEVKVVIVCGGTGGHLAPGIAMAQELVDRGHTCVLVLSRKEVDSRLYRRYPEFSALRVAGAPFRLHPLGFLRFATGVVASFRDANKYYRAERPTAVIAFGGFLSTAFVLAASVRDIPIFLHEANRRSGKAIRFLARFADRVYLPHGVKLRSLGRLGARHVGFPIRRDVRHVKKDIVRRTFDLPPHSKLLVVFGGSQGAAPLNAWLEENLDAFVSKGISVYCITGVGKGREWTEVRQSDAGDPVHVRFIAFGDDMGSLLSAADLVVSRAGAGSIAELIECLTPAILVPYPHAADRHQHENARYMEQCGASLVIDESEISNLRREVEDLIFNDGLLGVMRGNLRALNRGNQAAAVADDIEDRLAERAAAASVLKERKKGREVHT